MSTDAAVWGLIRDGVAPSGAAIRAAVGVDALRLGDAGVARAEASVSAAVLGAGPLEALLTHADVTDVLVNGSGGVWVDRGDGLTRADVEIGDEAAVRRLAVRLAGLAGRRLDDSAPWVDGLLPGGIRLHAVLPPLIDGGPHISLRVPRRVAPSLAELCAWGAFPETLLPVLRAVVASRASFVVSGGTGSGKTTLLAALIAEVDPAERIVLVEDVREMAAVHPHLVRLQTRPANVEGRGVVDMVDLVRQSLRMRPDRLIVGEVRGAEIREMLAALNTGHEGGACTVHANGVADLVARCEALGALAGLSPWALRTQLASAVSVIIQVRRSAGWRGVEAVAVLERTGDGEVAARPALRCDQGAVHRDVGWPMLAAALGITPECGGLS